MEFEPYDKARDREHCLRIWEEVGWIDSVNEPHSIRAESIFEAGRCLVARVNGEAECLVAAAPGTMRYLDADLPFSGVTAVTTSRIARRQGLASRLTARLIAEEVEAGAAVSGLGMFEQGYYNRLGFGTGPYEIQHRFDPGLLTVEIPRRAPRRLTREDYAPMHANRRVRARAHGAVSLDSALLTRGDFHESEKGFGLGFMDKTDALTHHFWCDVQDAEYGPYSVRWLCYRNGKELLELLGLLRGLAEQVRSVTMFEPPGVQLQDLLRRPIHHRGITHRSRYEITSGALAWWQLRICDLPACMQQTWLDASPVQFNLTLTDPISKYLKERDGWRGIAGDYIVTLGPESEARPGAAPGLPTLRASVNAFSRMWLGVRPATGLAATDHLMAEASLLAELDRVFRLPMPVRDWEF